MGVRWVVLMGQYNDVRILVHAVFVVSALILFVTEVRATVICESKVAYVVSAQGKVELRRVSQTSWQAVAQNTVLCAGDMLRVRARSRAALRLSNESMLRLDQKTTITFPEQSADKATSLLDLIKGALHIITRTPKPFKVRTPFLNGAVDGTEFYVGMDENSTTMVLYEGQITTSNAQGQLVLNGYEAAKATRNQPPQRIAVVKPTDAVQWALYYPTILDYTLNRQGSISTAQAFARQGRVHDALTELENIPQANRAAGFYIDQASLLLSVGRVDEAQASLSQAEPLALNNQTDNSTVNALKAIIAVVQNDKELALILAQQAVDLDDASPATWLALSYAQQAHFQIKAALTSVQQAVQLNKRNALAWARLAELHMSMSELDQALEAAQQAVTLNPDLAKTQTVLGFAYLLKIDTDEAKEIFQRAITLDEADPMPRLGMGLALIREGELEAGRVELEIAASLDPANSLIRSYLGKAYFEEKRYDLASTQFDLAKQRDPNDPTPWFYDAIQKQTQNRPVEALQDIQKSIELNDNRAVYRSRLLLDQDQAGRGSSLARIYDNLGFQKRALMETAKSLSFDPANHSAHRFLSDAYTQIPRHEIARVSELLQAQLLQPINVNPVQPRMAVADLNIITNTGPAIAGFNEFAPLMERNKPQLVASGIVGSHGTYGNEVVASALYDRASISLGQFHYESNGFRENNDQNHDVYNAFAQYAVTPQFNVQAEFRRRETKHGQLLLDFGRNKEDAPGFDGSRRSVRENVARVGVRYKFTPSQDLLISGKYIHRIEKNNSKAIDSGFQFDVQHIFQHQYLNTVLGGEIYRFYRDNSARDSRRQNIYFYSQINYFRNLNLTLGLSYDYFNSVITNKRKGKLNPKFGLQWNLVDNLRIRAAWFETTKSHLIAQQALEPTQVAGFNQFFDDINNTRSRRMGIGFDYHISNTIFAGMEASQRILRVPASLVVGELLEKQKESLYEVYLHWAPHPYWLVKGRFKFEKYLKPRKEDINFLDDPEPVKIHTLSAPVSIDYFHPSGLFSSVTGTFVEQELLRKGDIERGAMQQDKNSYSGKNMFFMFDTVIGYRLPSRRGILSLEGRNLLNEKFFFRSVNFYQSEAVSSRFVPERTFFARLTLNF